MSMRHYANSGYVLPVDDLLTLLLKRASSDAGEQLAERLTQIKEAGESEEMRRFLNDKRPEGFPPVASCFILGEEDNPQDLEAYVWYAQIEQADLFSLSPTPALQAMRQAGLGSLTFAYWCTFG